MKQNLKVAGNISEAEVKRTSDGVDVSLGGVSHLFTTLSGGENEVLVSAPGRLDRAFVLRVKDTIFLHLSGHTLSVEAVSSEQLAVAGDHHQDLSAVAPMPGTVIKVIAVEGAQVKRGEALVIVEAMKMENEVRAMTDAIVAKVMVKAGEKVGFGQQLVELIPPEA